jgi:hypothetical protein
MRTEWKVALAAVTAFGAFFLAAAQTSQKDAAPSAPATNPPLADSRELVRFPVPMRLHTIRNMRDHLLALQEINVALSKGEYDKAATIAEARLGMSSLKLHGADHIAMLMPKGMQDIGTRMHKAASRFAIEAQNASAGNDLKPALAALGSVMEQCVACHGTYRLQ